MPFNKSTPEGLAKYKAYQAKYHADAEKRKMLNKNRILKQLQENPLKKIYKKTAEAYDIDVSNDNIQDMKVKDLIEKPTVNNDQIVGFVKTTPKVPEIKIKTKFESDNPLSFTSMYNYFRYNEGYAKTVHKAEQTKNQDADRLYTLFNVIVNKSDDASRTKVAQETKQKQMNDIDNVVPILNDWKYIIGDDEEKGIIESVVSNVNTQNKLIHLLAEILKHYTPVANKIDYMSRQKYFIADSSWLHKADAFNIEKTTNPKYAVPNFNDILNQVQCVFNINSAESIYMECFKDAPSRDDFGNLLIVKEIPKELNNNYIVFENPNKVYIYLIYHKTILSQGQLPKPLSAQTVENLKDYMRDNGLDVFDGTKYLFNNPNTGMPFNNNKMGEWVGSFLKKAGLTNAVDKDYKDFTNQLLRVSHVSTFGKSKTPAELKEYMQLLGHTEQAHKKYYRVVENLYDIFPEAGKALDKAINTVEEEFDKNIRKNDENSEEVKEVKKEIKAVEKKGVPLRKKADIVSNKILKTIGALIDVGIIKTSRSGRVIKTIKR